MAIDEDFVKQFEEQIVVLENMKQAVQDAIDRAKGRLKRLQDGEPLDSVFEPPQQ